MNCWVACAVSLEWTTSLTSHEKHEKCHRDVNIDMNHEVQCMGSILDIALLMYGDICM